MRRFATISLTEAKGKKLESWEDSLKGKYYALGWYHTDFTGWNLNEIIEDIKKQRFKVDDKENQKEINSAIKVHSNFYQLKIGDIIAPINNRYGLFGIGIIKSEYKFKKHKHPTRTNDPNQVKFYSHYRDVDWIVTDYHKIEEIDFKNKPQWKPYGTINFGEEIPSYIIKLLKHKGVDLNLKSIDWNEQIIKWSSKRRTVKEYSNELILFFENVFKYTFYPDRAFFGFKKTTISLVIGHLYLGVYVHSGPDKGIGLMVDKEFPVGEGIKFHPVKSTLVSTSKFKLYWLWIADLSNLHKILSNDDVWQSFNDASKKVIETPQGKSIREKEKLGKIRLDKISIKKVIVNEIVYQNSLEENIKEAQKLSKQKRQLKLLEFPEIPERVTIQSTGFKRNQFVIIEALERANGICDSCNKDAPFVKIKNETPFLEVHHVNPLS